MSSPAWVYCGVDYAAHLLRHSAQPPCMVTARCGLEVWLSQGTIEHPAAPGGACKVCVQQYRNGLVSEVIAVLLTAPADQDVRLTGEQRAALQQLRHDLAARTPPDG